MRPICKEFTIQSVSRCQVVVSMHLIVEVDRIKLVMIPREKLMGEVPFSGDQKREK